MAPALVGSAKLLSGLKFIAVIWGGAEEVQKEAASLLGEGIG